MYILLGLALLALAITAAIGLDVVPVEHKVARHWQAALWAVLLVLMVHTLILFYFLATGKQLRVLMQTSGREVNRAYLAELLLYKKRVFPWVMWALFSTIAAFVVGGGVLVGAVPKPVHTGLGLLSLGSNFVGAVIEVRTIRRNSRLIHTIEREYIDDAGPADASRGLPDAPRV